MKTVFKNPLYKFIHDIEQNILIFDWTEATSNMTDEDFKEAISNYAGFAYELKGPGLLVDVRKFRHQLGEEAMQFRNTDCLNRYMDAGSYKMAYVGPPEMISQRPQGDVKIGAFTDHYFDNLDAAKSWLSD